MKCDKCGFIYKGEILKCPYCGSDVVQTEDFFQKKVFSVRNFSIRLYSLLYIIFINLFIAFLFADIFLIKSHFLVTLGAYFIMLGPMFIISFVKNHKSEILDIYIRIDIFLVIFIMLSMFILNKEAIGVDLRPYISLYVLPIYMILSTIVLIFLIFASKFKFKNVEFIFFTPLHFFIILVIFILELVNIKNDYTSFSFLTLPAIQSSGDILLAVSALVTLLFMIDFYIVIGYKIYSYARYKYGK